VLWPGAKPGSEKGDSPCGGIKTLLVTGRTNWTGGGKLIHTSDLPLQFINPSGTVGEVVSNRTGKPEHVLFAPQLPRPNRLSDERTAGLFGSMLAVYGNNNDTTVYRVSDRARLLAFFGRALAGDDAGGGNAHRHDDYEMN